MAWGNEGDVTRNQDMIDTNGRVLTCQGLVTAEANLVVGTDAVNGVINAADTDHDLELGGTTTRNVELSRVDKTTTVKGELQVNGDSVLLGDLRVRTNLTVDDLIALEGAVTIGDSDNDGTIDAGNAANRDLIIGNNATRNVLLSRSGKITNVKGELNVDEDTSLTGAVTIGDSATDGTIDAAHADRTLKLGTLATTKEVQIGQATGTTKLNNALQVEGNSTLKGELKVNDDAELKDLKVTATSNLIGAVTTGDANNDGSIDAASSSKNLKLGTDSNNTQNVIIARANKYARIDGNLCVNATETVIDGQTSLVAGSGFKYNAAGQVPPNASIDFYIGGVLVGFLDTNGWQ